MNKTLIIICCGLLIAGGLYFFRRSAVTGNIVVTPPTETAITYQKKEVMLGDFSFTLEIADTPLLQERGLSYRAGLAPNTGMLFAFDTPRVLKFWMKDMNFPIDIIWLDQNKKVVHIEHSLSPSTYPDSFGPETPTQYVIEIPAGGAKRAGVVVGNGVSF